MNDPTAIARDGTRVTVNLMTLARNISEKRVDEVRDAIETLLEPFVGQPVNDETKAKIHEALGVLEWPVEVRFQVPLHSETP